MSGLFQGLQVSLRSLSNLETAMSVIADNVSNVNTPGYSRKRVHFKSIPGETLVHGSLSDGAEISRIEAIRDSFIEKRILHEFQALGYLEGQEFGLGQIEALLSGNDSSVPDQLSRFFNSFLELAGDPASITLRQAALLEGENLAHAFHETYRQLDKVDSDNQMRIRDSVEKINSLLNRIADVNGKIFPKDAATSGGALEDERLELVKELSQEIDIVSYVTETGVQIISTSNGKTLLVGANVADMEAAANPDGFSIVLDGSDVTSDVHGGRLAGYLEIQENTIPNYKEKLNALANEFVDSVNAVHVTGFDMNGDAGVDLFTASSISAAETIEINISAPQKLAVATSGAGIGDGLIAQQIADLRDTRFDNLDGQNLNGYFSELVFQSGLEARFVRGGLETQQKIVGNVLDQRESISGVSLDEEAVNLLQFQRSYQASARLVQVIDQLLEETMNLVRV